MEASQWPCAVCRTLKLLRAIDRLFKTSGAVMSRSGCLHQRPCQSLRFLLRAVIREMLRHPWFLHDLSVVRKACCWNVCMCAFGNIRYLNRVSRVIDNARSGFLLVHCLTFFSFSFSNCVMWFLFQGIYRFVWSFWAMAIIVFLGC